MIEEQPKISEWIPIAEKLPEPGEYILLSFENYTLADIGGTRKMKMTQEHSIWEMRMKAVHQLTYL